MNKHQRRNTVPVNFRTAPSQKVATERLAKARGVSIAEVVRAALNEHVAKARDTGITGDTANEIVAIATPILQAEFDALTRTLNSLNERLDSLEAGQR